MKTRPINNPETWRKDKKYWNRVLQSHNLGMERGNQLVDSETDELIKKLKESNDRPA
jgi:hypothetical protein